MDLLTPAARQLLDEVVEDFKNGLLTRAEAAAAGATGDLREISVHDVLSALPTRKRFGRRSAAERLLVAYSVTGVLLAAGGLAFWTLQNVIRAADIRAQIPLLVSISGALLSLLSFTLLRLRTLRDHGVEGDSESEGVSAAEMRLVRLWQSLELQMRKTVAEYFGESGSSGPISSLIERLVSVGVLSKDDSVTLRKLIDLRNGILHRGEKVSLKVLRQAIDDGERLIERLSTAGRGRRVPV